MNPSIARALTALLIASLLCGAANAAPAQPPDDLALHSVGTWGLDLADRDASVKPGDDFYKSQNGAWFTRTELTPQTPFAAYWNDLRRLAPRRLSALLEEAAADANAAPASARGKAGSFYRAFVDEATVEARGTTPLEPELRALRAARTASQIAYVMGSAAGPGTMPAQRVIGFPADRAPFVLRVAQDSRRPERYALYVGQGGLGLPGPEYYTDPQLADVKGAYEAYAATMLALIGWPNSAVLAKEVVAFESRIAQASWSHEQMRDVVATDNRMTVAQLSAFAPGFDWRAFLAGAELRGADRVVVDAKSAFPKIARIVAETPLEVVRARQAFIAADVAAPNLNHAAFTANFDFRVRAFNNPSVVPRPRRIQAWYTLEPCIGDILGTLYTARYFSPEAKAAALEMSSTMRRAFDARLGRLTWMSDATKVRARAKLAAMRMNIGYPDDQVDYTSLKISDTDLYGDVVRATAFNWRRQARRLNAPFDRSEWQFTPQSVNYGYVPTTNTLEIPAATFQPPFFDVHADPAVNYGAVGALIGATMAGAFDNTGRHYDAAGRLHDWLTPAETRTFEAMTKAVADQYSAVEPLPGIHVKGELVADEAVDDIGGLLIALDAYHLALNGRQAPVLDGFTGDQRVFLGRAQMWRAKFDRAFVRSQIATGRNAQPFLRVNGPVRNIDAWYAAFGVTPNDTMYLAPSARVRVW